VEAVEARSAGDFPPMRMPVPCSLRDGGWPGFAGRVSFYRRFGRPSNLSSEESVWLVFECVAGKSAVTLNDLPLGELEGSGSFEVTGRLEERNRLQVIVEAADDSGGIVGEVALEIRDTNPPPTAPASRSSRPGESGSG
jgi:hypothetical protein